MGINSDFKFFIQTERLILRDIIAEDAAGMFELDSDPEVHRYLGNNPVSTLQQSADVIEFIRQQYIENGIGRWAVIEKKSGKFIGWSGLKLMRESLNNHIDFLDVGYRFIRKYWGKGYATESCVASLEYAFSKMNSQEVFATVDIGNSASQNVLEKSGLKRIEQIEAYGHPHFWYSIRRQEFYRKHQPEN